MLSGFAERVDLEGRRLWAQIEGLGERMRTFSAADWLRFGLLVSLAVLLLPMAVSLLGVAVILGAVFFWVAEFVRLMTWSPAHFPGRYDRAIWIALMLLAPPVGMVAFWLFRRSHEEGARVKPASPFADDDLY